jgi:arsenical pump membrane protein
MTRVLERLLLWVADALDRNLVTVPDVDELVGAGAVLGVLIGVNLGPNHTYGGSLATLLWRRVVTDHDAKVNLAQFTRLGLLTVPTALILAVGALWVSLHAVGG